ncbi:hypothetical protein DFQ01_101299 [Paenibacillus cellulosilyticus]|uniref:Uncharacterized protein n=1 Tax=Paenibacillus cellulosilyticus TaxID=375489 RepID=A0A2V2Z2T3_9BACL|nr:hypothetical protein [Paenibacillus cellulosilyticus]PWW08576.1 hypothetical protein DFQ01_101299 [Paenibacillus cellulosilyticus]QKS48147.1 hypothetical protein HUB94_28115 [Paenibacillus cellulosilyticus]
MASSQANRAVSQVRAHTQAQQTAQPFKLAVGNHYLTILFGAWLIGGVFVDGYAHNHGVVETFFTPWHAILYSGFLVCALWMSYLVYRTKRITGMSWRLSIPNGYGVGLLGAAVFLTGGLCDMAWHVIYGIEKDIAALLSPSHLMLLIGGIMILSSPFRSAWNEEQDAPSWREFAPPLLSVALTLSVVSFFLMYAWMFRYNLSSQPVTDWYLTKFYSGHIQQANEMRGLSYIILNTIQYMIPLLLLIKRWRLPFGAVTVLFTFVTVLMNVLDGFDNVAAIVIAFTAGVVGDLAYRWLRPNEASRLWAMRVFALLVPAVMWTFYFVWQSATDGIGWEIEAWTGAIVSAALASLALSLLAFTPRQPERRQDGA